MKRCCKGRYGAAALAKSGAVSEKDQRLYGPENLAIRLSRNGISEKPKLFFRNIKKHLEKYFSKENKQKSTKKTTMDPGHLMLNRSIFSLYPSLAAQLAASPPLLQNWGVGRPLTQFQPQPDIKIERDSCGGSSASNASDTNGSGDEVRYF